MGVGWWRWGLEWGDPAPTAGGGRGLCLCHAPARQPPVGHPTRQRRRGQLGKEEWGENRGRGQRVWRGGGVASGQGV